MPISGSRARTGTKWVSTFTVYHRICLENTPCPRILKERNQQLHQSTSALEMDVLRSHRLVICPGSSADYRKPCPPIGKSLLRLKLARKGGARNMYPCNPQDEGSAVRSRWHESLLIFTSSNLSLRKATGNPNWYAPIEKTQHTSLARTLLLNCYKPFCGYINRRYYILAHLCHTYRLCSS
jgi:hypothetical protein